MALWIVRARLETYVLWILSVWWASRSTAKVNHRR